MAVNISTTYSYINCNFTITKPALFYFRVSYENALTVALGVKGTNSATASSMGYVENYGEAENVGAIGLTAILYGNDVGKIYYVFAKGKVNGINTLYVYRLGPGSIN